MSRIRVLRLDISELPGGRWRFDVPALPGVTLEVDANSLFLALKEINILASEKAGEEVGFRFSGPVEHDRNS